MSRSKFIVTRSRVAAEFCECVVAPALISEGHNQDESVNWRYWRRQAVHHPRVWGTR